MNTDVRQGDIYHARPIRVIDTSSGHIPIKLGHTTGPTTPVVKDETGGSCNNEDVLSAKICDKESDMTIQRDVTPPLPPRGVKSILAVRDKFNYKKTNENRYVKFSDFEQKFLSGAGKVKNIVEKREQSSVTPPPKLPPRTRDVSTSALNTHAQTSVKQDAAKRQNGRVFPLDKRDYVSAFDKLTTEINRKDMTKRETTPSTPEPQPLTRTNVTCHDKIWNNESEETVANGLIPPLKHITPETTQEMFDKFDPLDVLDSGSEHSDSSADTMIMMTTEEEEQNKEKITQSLQSYRSSAGKSVKPVTENVELDIVQENAENELKAQEKRGKDALNQLSPKSEDTDDGYGTNSSQGTTVSSPLSSSLNSLETSDLETSGNGSLNRPSKYTSRNNSTSAIQNPTRGTWAVRRRTRMSEKLEECNSLQEKLRQLAIIEEEDGSQNDRERRKRGTTPTKTEQTSLQQEEINGPVPADLRKFEGDLYDKLTDMDRNYRNYYGFDSESDDKSEKVLYFQQKMLRQSYGSDNYYTPKSFEQPRSEKDFEALMNLGQGSLPMHINLGQFPRDYSSRESSSYRSNASSGYSTSIGERPDHVTNITYDQLPMQGTLPSMPSKGQYTSADNINLNGRKPLFASSADIHKLFQSRDNIHDQLQRPANCRHSFHAMPCTQQWLVDASQNQADANVPRERAASASAAMKSKSSWNPFGGMFSRKKHKNEQNKSSQDLNTAGKSAERSGRFPNTADPGAPEVPVRQPVIKTAYRNSQSQPAAGRTPSFRRYAEKSGFATLPNGNLQELPFHTVAVVEPSGTKLSTLV